VEEVVVEVDKPEDIKPPLIIPPDPPSVGDGGQGSHPKPEFPPSVDPAIDCSAIQVNHIQGNESIIFFCFNTTCGLLIHFL